MNVFDGLQSKPPRNRLSGLQLRPQIDPNVYETAHDTAKALQQATERTGVPVPTMFQALRPNEFADPTDIPSVIERATKLADRVSMQEAIEAGKQQFEPGREPSLIQQAKQWVRERTGLFEPPIYGQDFRETQPGKTLVQMGAHYGSAIVSGYGLSIPDILAHKVSGADGLTELVDRATGFRPRPSEITGGEILEFYGGLKTAGAVSRALVSRIAARQALKQVLTVGLQFSGRSLSDEVAQKIITGEEIDMKKVWAEGGVGVLFGIAEVALASGLRARDVRKLVKLYRQRIPGLDAMSDADLRSVASAAIDSRGVMAGTMTMEEWEAKHGYNVFRFAEKFKQVVEQAPKIAGEVAVGAGQAASPSAIVKAEGAAIQPIADMRMSLEVGRSLPPAEMRLLTELGVDTQGTVNAAPDASRSPSVRKGGDNIQQQIDAYEDALVAKYGEEALLDVDAQLAGTSPISKGELQEYERLIDARNSADAARATQLGQMVLRVFQEHGISEDVAKKAAGKFFGIGLPDKAGTRVYIMGSLSRKAFGDFEQTAKDLARYLMLNQEASEGRDAELMFGAQSPLTDKGKRDLLQQYADKAINILDNIERQAVLENQGVSNAEGATSQIEPTGQQEGLEGRTEGSLRVRDDGQNPETPETQAITYSPDDLVPSPEQTALEQEFPELRVGARRGGAGALPPGTDLGFPKEPEPRDPGYIKRAYGKIHDFLFRYGEAKRTDPELYKQAMAAYHARNARVDLAIKDVQNVLGKRQLTGEEDAALAFAYEDKRLKAPKGMEDLYEKYRSLMKGLEEQSIKEGLFKQPFNERMIEENKARLDDLRSKANTAANRKKIADLTAENEMLANMRYLPHEAVARRALEAKINTLDGKQRHIFFQQLTAEFKKRKGKLFLKDYVESGLLSTDDVRMTRLVTNAVADYYYRSSTKALYDWAKANSYIKRETAALREAGWLRAGELNVTAPELNGQVIHPVFGGVMDEMRRARIGRGGTISQVFGAVKQAQFLRPTLVLTYDVLQKYIKGMYMLDPRKEFRSLGLAAQQVWGKGFLWQQLSKDGLYQSPHEISRGSQEERVAKFVNSHDADLTIATKLIEKATDSLWSGAEHKAIVTNALMAATRAMAQITWTGDQILRTQSYLTLMQMGTPHDEAVRIAANSHAAYAALSENYRRTFSKLAFVPSFRVLMPIELGKIVTEPVTETIQAIANKQAIPKHKWERWVKSFVATVAIPFIVDEYMKMRGFEKTGKHLGPLAWKYKKDVVVDGQKHEIVVGLNYILNMPIKYWNRWTYYSPIKETIAPIQVLDNVIKWEAHPLIRIMVWDVLSNRRSLGGGEVYDKNDTLDKQLANTFAYVFGESFRFWGGFIDAVDGQGLTQTEKNQQEKVFDVGLSSLDTFMSHAFGYAYYRMPLKERQAIATVQMVNEYRSRVLNIHRKYKDEPVQRKEQLDNLNAWKDRCQKWIDGGME